MSRATVAGALLRGCLAALATVWLLVTVPMLAHTASVGDAGGPGTLATLAALTLAETTAIMVLHLPLALPSAALVAYRFGGGLGGALAIGAAAGAVIELALALALTGGLLDAMMIVPAAIGALAGAAFAWPVWHRCVAPRRRARAAAARAA